MMNEEALPAASHPPETPGQPGSRADCYGVVVSNIKSVVKERVLSYMWQNPKTVLNHVPGQERLTTIKLLGFLASD